MGLVSLVTIGAAWGVEGRGRNSNPTSGSSWNASVTVNLGATHPVSKTLYGIFFEEIGHAGEGGLYAELVQDRSFDAIARVSGFASSNAPALPVDLAKLAAQHRDAWTPTSWDLSVAEAATTKADFLDKLRGPGPRNDIIVAWQALPGTTTSLTRDKPLNPTNLVSMTLSATANGSVGIVNHGYWGMHVEKGQSYTVSLYARAGETGPVPLTVSILGASLKHTLASVDLNPPSEDWGRLTGTLEPNATDSGAVLVMSFEGPGSVVLDVVSLFPTENVKEAAERGEVNPWPFRADLLGALKALKPAFMRFPGGCYIEGDHLVNRFNWKDSIGPLEERSGHMNGVWGYWSTDGLGLFEYMQLAEALDTEPVWVINNGVAHADSVPASDIWPYVQDALDSLEFILGSPDSRWGSVRSSMGREQPWNITYVAIGNEDCGKWMYLNNYLAFFGALRGAHPHLRLISNCDMGRDAPTDIWDWHIYTNPRDLFNKRNIFDGRRPEDGHFVFASEYAVTEGGGWGNLVGAVAEAAFMTGLERNSEAVVMAAYAPLFVHTSNRPWPTNMIVIDNHRWFGIPSYHVQRLFRENQGVRYAETAVAASPSAQLHEDSVAASATCQDDECTTLVVKVINFSSYNQTIRIQLDGLAANQRVEDGGDLTWLTSGHPEDENTFDDPHKVTPRSTSLSGLDSDFRLQTAPYSVNLLTVQLGSGEAPDAYVAAAM
ncbi:Alpha-L-arabinofuranosidase 1 [Auxenochlorella protothecoides]|nr:Alpha-L-arabinofuranosidase 1 [Auxenochlorella protothecoides]KFM27338.1 Alpha-L-arabinofuranosidase 1 [Auxenochlorella protothecoides]RMZ57499.1 hypothetical protein APUTEX25_003742 [Auxenochlorella protothecoides]|eukprot:RMZ57499.1 hypothetical protein APUTEX25_003742 [Auxenochlorella protothecoides]